MRRRAAIGAPGLGQRRHLLYSWPLLQSQPQLYRLLNGEIAGRPGVAMAEAEQQINVGGPWADAMQRGQRVVRSVDILVGEHVEVQPVGREFFRDEFQCLD